MSGPTSAIVLAGGRSRRLGQDKRLLRLATGRTQLEDTISRVAVVADDVIVAGAMDLASDHPSGIRWIPDAAVSVGPLGGLIGGLTVARHEFVLAVACDLPLLDVNLLQALVEWPRDYDLLVPRRPDGTLEMLHAIYRATCLDAATRLLRDRQLKLSELAAALGAAGLAVRYVGDDELARFNPGLTSFFNVNTAADLRIAEDLVAKAGSNVG